MRQATTRRGTTLILSAAIGLSCWGIANAGDEKTGECCVGATSKAALVKASCDTKTETVGLTGSCDAKTETVASKDGCDAKTETVASKGSCEMKTETVALKDDAAKAEAPVAAKQFEAIKALAGTWESIDKGPDGKTAICEFKVTSNGTVVHETMFPGAGHEMVNMYHLDGDKLIITHYCAQGIQPRMKMSGVDGKTIKFDFLDCTNLPSPDAPRMNDLALTIDGDTIKESWGYFKDGKVSDYTNIEMKKKP